MLDRTLDATDSRPRHRLVVLAIPLMAAAAMLLWYRVPGPFNLALALLLAATALAVFVWRAPLEAAALLPILLPPPQVAKVFAYELALLGTSAILLLAGIRGRRDWTWRLDPIEIAVAALMLWGVASVFWVTSVWWWLFTVRKMLIGCIALWTAWRLSREFGSERMKVGVVAGAFVLSLATLAKALTSGFLVSGGGFRRMEGTDLEWGTSNFIAALLLVMLPTALHLALESRSRVVRAFSWSVLPLVAMVMSAAASRGGALLLVIVVIAFGVTRRFGKQTLGMIGVTLALVALVLLGPGGKELIERFFVPREQGSVLIRLLFFREGWIRFVDHLPWGLGIGQGYVQTDRLGSRGPHNFLILLGSEMGLPGLLLWGVVLLLIARRALRHMSIPALRSPAHVLLVSLIVMFVNSQFEGTIEGLQYQFLFYWIMGIYLGELARGPRNVMPERAPAAG